MTDINIYAIQPKVEHEPFEVYYGSTSRDINDRFKSHIGGYISYNNNGIGSRCMSFLLFDNYGVENCEIKLVERIRCEDFNERNARERHYIETMPCVNKNKPLTPEERENYQINYRQTHREHIKNLMAKKYVCACGHKVRMTSKTGHFSTKKHFKGLKTCVILNNQ